MPETTPLIKAALNLRGGAGFDVYEITMNKNQVEKVIWWALKNLLGNLLPFIPFGFLLPIAYPRIKAFFKVFLVGMFAVLFIEIFQYMTRLGSFDIDDIILNMVGVLSGYGTFGLVNMFC